LFRRKLGEHSSAGDPQAFYFFVMAGHSRPKDGVASARLCPGHPRLSFRSY
jgi:hypothetical protein